MQVVARAHHGAVPAASPVTYSLRQIPIDRIRAFAFQPRKWFDPREIRARAASMRAMGQQDPVTVEPITGDRDHDYELINGESRLRSARKAGIAVLWAAVRSTPFASRTAKHMASLVANFNRSDHTPMEISDALHVQVTEGGRSQSEIALALGRTDFWVSAYLSLQNLHPEIKPLLHPTTHKSKRIAPAIGFALSRIDRDQQLKIVAEARGADGRVTLLRVKIATELSGIQKRTRTQSPSKRREKIVNTVRALKLDLAKLESVISSDRKEVAKVLAEGDVLAQGIETLQTAAAAVGDGWTPERFERYRQHHDADPEHVQKLQAGISGFRSMLEARYGKSTVSA